MYASRRRLARLALRVPEPPCGEWCRVCSGRHVAEADDLRRLVECCQRDPRPRLCGCACCAELRPVARRYLRARASWQQADGLVDIEPCIRILAKGFGLDPEVAVAEAARLLAEGEGDTSRDAG